MAQSLRQKQKGNLNENLTPVLEALASSRKRKKLKRQPVFRNGLQEIKMNIGIRSGGVI
jgi:hypothetical protein